MASTSSATRRTMRWTMEQGMSNTLETALYGVPLARQKRNTRVWIVALLRRSSSTVRASLLSPKPLKACAPLTHSTQSSSAGVCSDLGKEGKEKLFRAQTFFKIGLLNYDKNPNHDYFGQYCNHDYLKLLLVGHMTKTLYESFI